MQSIGNWQFNLCGPKDRPLRVLLLGQPGVGKTAMAVRLASRRFIGEYDCVTERLYRVEGQQAAGWEVADLPGTRLPTEARLRWAEAVVIVYSVTDRVSFDETWRLRFLLNQARKRTPVVVLVGNKTDLGAGPPADGDRMVSTAEGRRRAADIGAHDFHEISARESYEQVMAVFASAARLAGLLLQHRPAVDEIVSSSFRLRASTDGSIAASRRPQAHHSLFKRRLSISARGAPQ